MWTRLPPALALSLFACGGKDDGTDSSCIEGAAEPSVQVVVTDSVGTPLNDATVTWSDGGGAEPCDLVGTNFLCGFDNTGTLTITGEAPGHVSQSVEVNVTSDGCHAVTELLSLRLEPA